MEGRLTAPGKLRLRFVGGQDGVTGANQFEAQPDTSSSLDTQDALLLPGSAALAWLAGDSRVRFDATRLIPLLASVSPGVMMARSAGGPAVLRVACAGATEAGMAGLLGLDLLGIPARAAAPMQDHAMAVRDGLVDAVFLRGSGVPANRAALQATGLSPCFAVGLGEDGMIRDPALADVPTLAALMAGRPRADAALMAAWRAAASASVLDMALALPALSLPASVSRWRLACLGTLASPDVQAEARGRAVRLLAGPGCSAAMADAAADGAAQLALRRWMTTRLGWHPG